MGAAQSDAWPKGKNWEEVPEIASAALRKRYNRGIDATPDEVTKFPRIRKRLVKEALDRARLVPLPIYKKEQLQIMTGKGYRDGKKTFKIGDPVMLPIPKVVRTKIKAKNHTMHYSLMPAVISMIFHGRKPAMYQVRNPRTNKVFKRHYYASELKHLPLPNGVQPGSILSYKIVDGGVDYNVEGKDRPVRVV